MRRNLSYISLFLLYLLLWTGCGKKGPLIPPVVKIPQKIKIPEVKQKGIKIFLKWKNPDAYVDGNPLEEIAEIEIWMLEEDVTEEESPPKMTTEIFIEEAEFLVSLKPEDLEEIKVASESEPVEYEYRHELALDKIKGKKYTFSLRAVDKKKKFSDYSDPIMIETKIIPFPPSEIKARVFADRIELNWVPPEKNVDDSSPAVVEGYNIYRWEKNEAPVRINVGLLTPRKTYSDKDFKFQTTYVYSVRASATRYPFYESEDPETIEIKAEDTFPPEAPTGLVSIVGDDFISLAWDANQENDLAGYRVWRREEGKEKYTLLTPEMISETAYNDPSIRKNKKYNYAVSAIDNAGNESPRSKDLTEIIRKVPDENLSISI